MSKLPVSVIVPFTPSRADFFEGYCLPSIEANQPEEIIILDDDLSAPVKRNRGAEKARGKYLFFCDDDNILKKHCLTTFVEALEKEKEAAYAYCHYVLLAIHPAYDPLKRNRLHLAKPFDGDSLKKGNYIDTGSLIRADDFPGFDESIERYQDWDLWLTLLSQGKKGHFVNEILFLSFGLEPGISTKVPHEEAVAAIIAKHKL